MRRDQRELQLMSTETFMRKVAEDVVWLADSSEGLDAWLNRHSGSSSAPSRATRSFAMGVYGDDDKASLFNACLILEVDKHLRAA